MRLRRSYEFGEKRGGVNKESGGCNELNANLFFSSLKADPYVIFLQADKGMSYSTASKVATIVSVGGILGSPIVGWFSQTIGRRRALVFSGIFIGALIPWTIIPKNHISLAFGGFLTTFL